MATAKTKQSNLFIIEPITLATRDRFFTASSVSSRACSTSITSFGIKSVVRSIVSLGNESIKHNYSDLKLNYKTSYINYKTKNTLWKHLKTLCYWLQLPVFLTQQQSGSKAAYFIGDTHLNWVSREAITL